MFVSVVFVRAIVSELQGRGMSLTQVLAGIGVREEQLNDLRVRFAYSEMNTIVTRAMELAQDPGLGLAIGMHAPESMLQVLGHLIVSCRTLRDAVGLFQRYVPLVAEGMSWTLSEENELARFTYTCPVQLASSPFAAEIAMALACRYAGYFKNTFEPQPTLITFEHAEPEYHARYARAFAGPVRFSQSSNSHVFPRAWSPS